jgi:hypothetical protein
MVDVEACQIEFAFPPGAMKHATWGGQIAIYDVSVGSNGAVTAVKRRMMEGREHLAKLVKLAPFESCIHGWRFQERGEYTMSLIGGNVTGPHWIIDVRADSRWFRLRIPVTADRLTLLRSVGRYHLGTLPWLANPPRRPAIDPAQSFLQRHSHGAVHRSPA